MSLITSNFHLELAIFTYNYQVPFAGTCSTCTWGLKLITGDCHLSVTFQSFLVTRWNSLVARYSLQNHSLLVGEVACCKKSLVICFKFRSLLVAEINHFTRFLVVKLTRYLLQNKKQQHQQNLNKYTIEILVIYILPMYTLNLTLSTLLRPIQNPVR